MDGQPDDSSRGVQKTWTKAPPTDDLTLLLATLNGKAQGKRVAIHELMDRLEAQLQDRVTASATANRILERCRDYDLGMVLDLRLEAMIRDGQSVRAAELWIKSLRSHLVVRTMGRGGVAIGKVIVEDGKLDPELVLAQMPILEGGYFAGEVGDFTRPVRFRAAGYEEVEISLAGKRSSIVDVGTVVLKPLPPERAASLKAKVALDIAERGPPSVKISLSTPRGNTPYFGVTPRRRWPEPTTLKVNDDGELNVKGLTPGEYYMEILAKDHAPYTRMIRLTPGKELDRGTIKLHTTDFEHFIGKPAPRLGDLRWEKEFNVALRRAAIERKPVLLMMVDRNSAQWIALEKETLSDPWVKNFLSSFVLVKTLEDKAVEAQYQANIYPTLVFLDQDGREVRRTSGQQPAAVFLGHCVRALRLLAVDLPAELQLLVDRKVVADE